MKKLFAIVMVLSMLLSLAACSSTDKSGDTETSDVSSETKGDEVADTTTEESTDAPATSEDNTLTVWCWDPAFNIYAMKEAEKIYQKINPDFKLEIIETPWGDVQTKLTTAATSGNYDTLPDIFLCQDGAFQKNNINFPDVFADLTSSGIDFSAFAQAKVAYSTVDGKNYGVPFDNGTSITALRTDVLEEAGYTLADFTNITWDKFIELGKDVLAKTNKPLLSGIAGSTDLIMQMYQSCGGNLFKEDGSANIVGNEALIEAINVYKELVESGVFVEVSDWDQYIGSFTNGTVAGTINGCWILGSIQTATDQSGKWGLTNLPSLNDIANATNYANNGGSSWAITSNCDNYDLAVDFFKNSFAGSVEFYETILPSSGALPTYLPAGNSDVYSVPSDFFGGQAIFADIIDYAGKVPSTNTGVYYYEAIDAINVVATNVVGGADINSELENAQQTVEFQMGQ